MKVLYDFQAFDLQRFGGVSNYYVQIIRNLPNDVQYEIAVSESNNMHLRDSGLVNVRPALLTEEHFITEKRFIGKNRLYRLYSKVFPNKTSFGRNYNKSLESLRKRAFDVFHPTFFSDYFLPYLNGKPYVLTIHDMIPELYPNIIGKRSMQSVNIRKLSAGASHIVAVSENTKNDIMDLLHIPEQKISVIYHAAPEIYENETAEAIIKGRYILYVGKRAGYKNFLAMINELSPVLKKHHDIKVVCTGETFNSQEEKNFEKNGIKGRVIHVRASDSDMMNLYAHAFCFIYPSLYEGFGIPILEAWKAGCPVLLNQKSCFPEITGDASIFFHLDETHSDLTNVMENFIEMSEVEKAALIQKQNKRLEDFSWKESAVQLANVYRMVIEH